MLRCVREFANTSVVPLELAVLEAPEADELELEPEAPEEEPEEAPEVLLAEVPLAVPFVAEEAAELELSPEEAELLSSTEEEVALVASLPSATESEM